MNWRASAFPLLVVLLTVSHTVLPSDEADPTTLSDADIEEAYEFVDEYLGSLLEVYDYSIDDLPNSLRHLITKYFFLFSMMETIEPLVTFEQMIIDYNTVNDYNNIHNCQQKMAEDFPEYIQHFVQLNEMDDSEALEEFVDDLMDNFDFRVEVVSRADAVKFLLYKEAYPDIMHVISEVVRVIGDQHLGDIILNDEDDELDLTSLFRVLVAFHGRMELVKRWLIRLESYLPTLDRMKLNVDDSALEYLEYLEYLDDLKDVLEANSYKLWRSIKGSTYKRVTDGWIANVKAFLRDLLTFTPLSELFNFLDEIVLNSNNRLAVIAVRYDRERSRRDNYQLPNKGDGNAMVAENIWDVLNGMSKVAVIFRDVFHDIVTGEPEFSEDAFLEYVSDVLDDYDMSIEDLSHGLRSIVSRYFTRVNSVEGQSLNDAEEKILEMNLLTIHTNLEKVRDAIGNLIPEQTEENHIELDALLQLIVNKFGPFFFVMEESAVNFYNSLSEYRPSEQFVYNEVNRLADTLNTFEHIFQTTGKKPSEIVEERLSADYLQKLIDLFVDFLTFK